MLRGAPTRCSGREVARPVARADIWYLQRLFLFLERIISKFQPSLRHLRARPGSAGRTSHPSGRSCRATQLLAGSPAAPGSLLGPAPPVTPAVPCWPLLALPVPGASPAGAPTATRQEWPVHPSSPLGTHTDSICDTSILLGAWRPHPHPGRAGEGSGKLHTEDTRAFSSHPGGGGAVVGEPGPFRPTSGLDREDREGDGVSVWAGSGRNELRQRARRGGGLPGGSASPHLRPRSGAAVLFLPAGPASGAPTERAWVPRAPSWCPTGEVLPSPLASRRQGCVTPAGT